MAFAEITSHSDRFERTRPFFRIDYHLESTLRVCHHRYRYLLKEVAQKFPSFGRRRKNEPHYRRGVVAQWHGLQPLPSQAPSGLSATLEKNPMKSRVPRDVKAPSGLTVEQQLNFYGELSAAIDVTLQQSNWFSAEQAMAYMEDALQTAMRLSQLYVNQPEVKYLSEGVVIQIAEKLKTFSKVVLGQEWLPPTRTTSSACSEYCPTFGASGMSREATAYPAYQNDDHASPRSVFSFCPSDAAAAARTAPNACGKGYPNGTGDTHKQVPSDAHMKPDLPPPLEPCFSTEYSSGESCSIQLRMADVLYRHRTTSDTQPSPSETSQGPFTDADDLLTAAYNESSQQEDLAQKLNKKLEHRPLYYRSGSSISTHCPQSPPLRGSPPNECEQLNDDVRAVIDRSSVLTPRTYLAKTKANQDITTNISPSGTHRPHLDASRKAPTVTASFSTVHEEIQPNSNNSDTEYRLTPTDAASSGNNASRSTLHREAERMECASPQSNGSPAERHSDPVGTPRPTLQLNKIAASGGSSSHDVTSFSVSHPLNVSAEQLRARVTRQDRTVTKTHLLPFLPHRPWTQAEPQGDIEIHGRAGESLKTLPKPRSLFGDRHPQTLTVESLQQIMQQRREQYDKYAVVTFGSRDPRCPKDKGETPRLPINS